MIDDDGNLLCPECGDCTLHRETVTVFDRIEDDTVTMLTEVERGEVEQHDVASTRTRNPSGRRHGVTITFWCENCTNLYDLTLAQHKGGTVVTWKLGGPRGLLPRNETAAG
jgi:hypothetical protein